MNCKGLDELKNGAERGCQCGVPGTGKSPDPPERERETERGREEYEVISPAHEFEGTR